MKISAKYPRHRTLKNILCEAADLLMEAQNPRNNWKTKVIYAEGCIERAIQLCEAEIIKSSHES